MPVPYKSEWRQEYYVLPARKSFLILFLKCKNFARFSNVTTPSPGLRFSHFL